MANNEVKLRLSVDGAAAVVSDVDRVGDKLGTLDSRARQAAQGADTLKTALGAMATMGSVYAMVKMADAVTTLNTQLRLSSNSAAEAAKAYTSLFDIAQKGRVSFTELGTTYAAIARTGKELGVSQARLLTVTQSISQAMTIGGGSAASMQAALVQLGQGLSSGVLRGEELNSIMEQTPRLAKALADGLGVPIGKLRELGAAGQLTSEQVISALEKAGPQLAKEMESATLTVGQAFTMLTNSATNFIGVADAASGASGTLAGALKGVSGSIDTVGQAIKNNETAFNLITGGLAGAATAAGLALVVKRIYEARTAVIALGVAAAANPVILAIAAIGATVGGMVAIADKFTNSAQGMRAEIGSLNNSIANIDATMAKGADSESIAARASSAILRQSLVEKRDAVAQKLAMLGQVEEGEGRFSQAIDKFNRESAKSEEELIALRQKASGVAADYLPTLEKYQALLKSGKLEEKEYISLVSDLATKNYKKAASVKVNSDAEKEHSERVRYGRAMAIAAGEAVEDANKAYQKSLAEVTKEHEKYIGTLEKSADTIAAQVLKLQDEEAAAVIAASQYISLAQAIEQVTIARLQSQADQLSLNGNDAGASAIQREIDDRKKLISLIGGKEAREATAKSAKEAAAEWQKTADKINDSITDALMRGFESGKGFGENLRDTLTNMFKTMILRPTISAIVNPVTQGITGAMGLAGSAQAGQGGSALDAAGNIMTAGNLLGGGGMAGSLMAGAGWMTGATTFGGALSAGASLVGTGTLAGGLSGLGMIAGALGPIALGVAALSMIGNKDKATSNTGNASANYDASGNRTGYQTYYGGSSEGVDKMLADLQTSYAVTAKALGIITSATEFSYGGNTGRNGESPNFALTGGAGGSKFVQGETTSSDAAISLAASRAVFAALQGSELPAYLSSMFDGLSAGAMTQEQITNTLAYAGSIKQVREALLETREPMAILQSNVDQAFSTLATTSESFKTDFVSAIDGGISPEKLAQWQSLQTAMTELASLAEKEATAKEAAAQKVRDAVQREVDKEIATVTTWTQKLAVLQGTVTERQLAMQADLATTTNAATQELIKQVYAQEDLKLATQTAKDSLKTLSESLKSLSSNVAGAQSSITDLQLQAQIDAANTANAAAEKFRGLNKSLREFLDGETLAPSASFGKLLAKAMGGDSDAMQALPGAASASIEFAKNRAATSTDFALQKAGILTQVAQAANAAALLAAQTVAVPQAADPMAQAITALETAVRELKDGIAQSIGVDLVNRIGEIDTNLSGSIDRLEFGRYFDGLASDATLQSIYTQLDVNGDGQITKLEAIRVSTDAATSAVGSMQSVISNTLLNGFSKIDTSVNGLLDYSEFAAGLNGLATDSQLKALFTEIDVNGDGQITKLEAVRLTAGETTLAVGSMQSVISNTLVNGFSKLDTSVNGLLDYSEFAAGLNGLATDSQLKALFTEIDVNGDGQITQLEAIRLATLDIKTASAATAASTSIFASGDFRAVSFSPSDPIRSVFNNIDQTNQLLLKSLKMDLTYLLGTWVDDNMHAQGALDSVFKGLYNIQLNSSQYLQTIAANSVYFGQMAANSATTAANTGGINHAAADGYLDTIAYHVKTYLQWIALQSYDINWRLTNGALVKFDRAAYTGGVYAHGGAFTNSVVSTPTSFDTGLMGEAGPEAIMPLVNIGGNLGVRSTGGNGRDMARLEALVERLTKEVEGLRTEARATASNTGKTARALDGVINGEDAINTVAA